MNRLQKDFQALIEGKERTPDNEHIISGIIEAIDSYSNNNPLSVIDLTENPLEGADLHNFRKL